MPELDPSVIVTEEEFHIFPGDLGYDDVRGDTDRVPDRHVEAVKSVLERELGRLRGNPPGPRPV